MGLPDYELQKRIITRLDAELSPIQAYDTAPASASPPYVTIGEIISRNIEHKTKKMFETSILLHAWSVKKSRKDILQLIDDVHAALDGYALPLAGFNLVELMHDQTEGVFLDEDGATWHGVIRFKAITETI